MRRQRQRLWLLLGLLGSSSHAKVLHASVPFTNRDGSSVAALGLSHTAAILLAFSDHVAILPNVTNCSSTNWTLQVYDSHSQGSVAVRQLVDQRPDAVVGGYHQYGESPSVDLVSLTTALLLPTVVYGGSNLRVVQSVPRTYPDGLAWGWALVEYVRDVLRRDNFVSLVLPSVSELVRQNEQVLKQAMQTWDVQVVGYSVDDYVPGWNAQRALQAVESKGFRTIFLLLDDWEKELPIVAQAAEESGLNTEDYVWVLVGALNLDYLRTAPPLVKKLVDGAATVQPLEAFAWDAVDPFYVAWKNATPDMVDRLRQLSPVPVPDDFFGNTDPLPGSGYAFDATTTLLLGDCYDSLFDVPPFRGPSGLVAFADDDQYPGSRAGHTVHFGAYNLQADGSSQLVALREASDEPGVSLPWKVKMPFVFRGGSIRAPELLRDVPEQNHLSNGVRIWGFCLYGSVNLVSITSILWIVMHREAHIVRAAQPIFLCTLLLGSMVLSLAILTSSFDEGSDWSTSSLSRACTATPWMIVSGIQLIYSSLFCKLWRMNKVLQFRRRKVTVQSVVWPMLALFVVVWILLIVWTILEGLTWTRREIDEETGESMACCLGDNAAAWFIPIASLVAVPLVCTGVLSWKCRDIDERYSDGKLLFSLVLFQLQVLLISAPLMFLVNDKSTETKYIGHVIIYFFFAISSSGFMAFPKIYRYYFPETEAKRGTSSGTVRVSGLDQKASSGVPTESQTGRTISTAHRSTGPSIIEASETEAAHQDTVETGQSITSEPHEDDCVEENDEDDKSTDDTDTTPPKYFM